MCCIFTGYFQWECANILIGSGDPYSTAGIQSFESAAIKSGIDVVTKVTYEAGSTDMTAPIKKIIDNSACLVTVLFGQAQDLASLLIEAHRQNYAGEWVIGDNIMGTLDGVVKDLKNHLDDPAIHKLLRGKFEFA